ncbi:DUF3800 domain-containing protein [candidate division KSB1 bacterium]|nr:DUF3800 domain-containing protein [candidate division KSB1 bacterium]
MYLCYVDESGFNGKKLNENQPVQTMVGIFPNLYSFHKSDAEFKEVFKIINKRIPINELKANEIYRGRQSWANIEPDVRDKVIEYYFNWIRNRNHKFIISTIDNSVFFNMKKEKKDNIFFKDCPFPWLLGAFHISIVI